MVKNHQRLSPFSPRSLVSAFAFVSRHRSFLSSGMDHLIIMGSTINNTPQSMPFRIIPSHAYRTCLYSSTTNQDAKEHFKRTASPSIQSNTILLG
ncbi:hypothetical protein H5410_016801 [Solanum commersonii]|uniref:Uncharacterized protein n=1 Tax=Solanum commersonii TaxID=4109 RepID=A0A9J5ZXI3_SOLCO|nr:hypothetical protein H5410_016801 [Solanum commersonii]